MFRWLLLAKLCQQSGDADGYVNAQGQAIQLQCMLLEHVRQPDMLGAAAAAAVFQHDPVSTAGCSGLSSWPDGTATSTADGMPVAVAAMTTSASDKAAGMCFDLAEYHKQRHQIDKVSDDFWLPQFSCTAHVGLNPEHSRQSFNQL